MGNLTRRIACLDGHELVYRTTGEPLFPPETFGSVERSCGGPDR